MIRRPPRSTPLYSSAASDVYKRQHFGSESAGLSVLPVSLQHGHLAAYPWMPLTALGVFFFMQWWAAWYPGAEPGGGGYVAQRIFSARTERDGVLATLFFQVAHYALRPWPWIITGLATIILYPNLQDKESGYVHACLLYTSPS